jgi:hypothetical protein
MKTKILQTSCIFFITIISICCSKKDEENIPKDLIDWTKPATFKGALTGRAYLTKKSDDGFLVSGYVYYTDSLLSEGFVTNMDSNGDTIWSRKIRIENLPFNIIYYAIQKSSDEILIAGVCSDGLQNKQRFIAWLDGDGNLIKDVLFPVAEGYTIDGCKLLLLPDGRIYYACMIAGQNLYLISNANTLRIDLLDVDGQLTRTREYSEVHTFLDRLTLLSDGKLLVAGTTLGEYPNYSDFLYLLINESGDEIYRRIFGSDTYDIGYSVCDDHNGGYLVSGMLTYSSTAAIFPVSASGNVGESIEIADSIYSFATVIKEARDGGYNLFIESARRFYFMKLGADFKVKRTLWFDDHYSANIGPWPIREILRLSDGSFAFMYYNDLYGQVIVKTIPLD